MPGQAPSGLPLPLRERSGGTMQRGLGHCRPDYAPDRRDLRLAGFAAITPPRYRRRLRVPAGAPLVSR